MFSNGCAFKRQMVYLLSRREPHVGGVPVVLVVLQSSGTPHGRMGPLLYSEAGLGSSKLRGAADKCRPLSCHKWRRRPVEQGFEPSDIGITGKRKGEKVCRRKSDCVDLFSHAVSLLLHCNTALVGGGGRGDGP